VLRVAGSSWLAYQNLAARPDGQAFLGQEVNAIAGYLAAESRHQQPAAVLLDLIDDMDSQPAVGRKAQVGGLASGYCWNSAKRAFILSTNGDAATCGVIVIWD
jgi:hypothetical protein